jgi:Transposase
MPRSLPPSVVRILRQSRWSPADARLVLDAVAATGHSFLEFAREHDVDVQRLYAWRRRLASPPVDAIQTFVEFRAPEAASPLPTSARYELQLPTGEVLRVEGAVDPATVGALLAVLRVGRAC